MTRERWMALFFVGGSTCFLVAPFPGYASLVRGSADSVTFFVGSILFTAGGAAQTWLAVSARHSSGRGPAALKAAAIQSAGTLFFNVTTYRALHAALHSSTYHKLVWRPDTLGSLCFLLSGAIAYRASARHGWRPAHNRSGWWEPAINLLGCVFFGISAVAGLIALATSSSLAPHVANWNISLGAACFLTCALATLLTGRTSKSSLDPADHRPQRAQALARRERHPLRGRQGEIVRHGSDGQTKRLGISGDGLDPPLTEAALTTAPADNDDPDQ